MGERIPARPPLYLDLSESWRTQPRDSHGRWTRGGDDALKLAGGPSAFGPLRAAPGAPPPTAFLVKPPKTKAKAAREVVHATSLAQKAEDPRVLRHFRKFTEEMQAQLFEDAGMKMKFPEMSTLDLISAYHHPGHTQAERLEYRAEIERRMAQLHLVAEAMDQSMTDFAREGRRDAFRKFDQNLRNLPGGRQVIALRERILNDKVLDHSEVLRRWFHEKGKGYAKHVATVVAISSLLHPLGLAAIGGLGVAGLLNVPGASEAFSGLLENLWIHSGVAVALEPAVEKLVGPIFRPFEKGRKVKRAQKYALKHQTRRLHV